jgi:hypothetical protein
MLRKKGEIEIQFNWILIMIAGALIFLFFFSIIQWAKKSADTSSSTTLAIELDAMFTAAETAKSTVNEIPLPFKKIEFSCNNFKVDNNPNPRKILDKIIFAPTWIDEGSILTLSMPWEVPFRVTNFLFVSSPKIRYIIIGDPDNNIFRYLKEVFSTFDEKFNVEFNPPLIQDNNNYKVRIIFAGATLDSAYISNLKKMSSFDVTALVIDGNNLEQATPINFYKKSDPGSAQFISYPKDIPIQSYVLGKASLLAAVFSEDPDDYECNMEKAFTRLQSLSKIYEGRSISIKSHYSAVGDIYCENIHDIDFTSISNIGLYSESSYSDLSLFIREIKEKNQQAQRNSCALIY